MIYEDNSPEMMAKIVYSKTINRTQNDRKGFQRKGTGLAECA